MKRQPYLSLCIPTNGVIEWVSPVLNSIYDEKNPIGEFEVIVTDNGNNEEFYEFMQSYAKTHSNLIYKKTDAIMFENQIEAFKIASGKLIKFVKHRMMLLPGTLNYLLKFVIENEEKKPVVYFLDNGCAGRYDNFDHFVKALSYWSSYSAGVAMWKSDFNNMDLNKPFNKLFPHTNMIFSVKNRKEYIIDGHKIMKEELTDATKKGRYNLFYAFAVEYPAVILELYRDGDVSYETLKSVMRDNYEFIAKLYWDYVIMRKPCSYKLEDIKKNVNIFYNYSFLIIKSIKGVIKRKLINKINRS